MKYHFRGFFSRHYAKKANLRHYSTRKLASFFKMVHLTYFLFHFFVYYLFFCKKFINALTIRSDACPSPYGFEAFAIASYATVSFNNCFASV